MRIREVTWSNYRRLADGKITVRNNLILVGPNDTGKSSIARALYLCLGMGHGQVAGAISVRDFTEPSLPLVLTITLDGIEHEDRKAFPDEITTGPPEVLVARLEATVDPADTEQTIVKRCFPDSGHDRAPTKEQLKTIGFQFVPAARSLLRELGGASGGTVRSLLSGLDLTADAAALKIAADGYRGALDGSTALNGFRKELAQALTDALPQPVEERHVRVVSASELLEDPLSGVTVTVKDGTHDVPLAEQSDGIRALSVLTLLGMSHKSARIVAIDEPETHLHPAAQRSVGRSLRSGTGQRVLVTHSPSIVGQMDPMDIVAFRADRQARQLAPGASIAEHEKVVCHWSHRLIEPLTARRIAAVEGPSDRILFSRVAELVGMDLDRMGVCVFDLDGAGLFGMAHQLFGPPGFDLFLAGLADEDQRADWAGIVGVPPADLETAGYIVCDPDLEGVYIDTLGVDKVISWLLASPGINEPSILSSCKVASISDMTRDLLWRYCRHKSRKVRAALAVAAGLKKGEALSLKPLNRLLQLVS